VERDLQVMGVRCRELVIDRENGGTLFDRPKPTVGCSANGRRRIWRRKVGGGEEGEEEGEKGGEGGGGKGGGEEKGEAEEEEKRRRRRRRKSRNIHCIL
jgi:hypothetical protein